jgi:hypothetical protein
MAVPWLQIVQLVPSIVEVSRELLKKSKRTDLAPGAANGDAGVDALLARIAALEEHERKQAELVSQMAQQIAVLSRAASALHQRAVWLAVGCGVTSIVAVAALIIAL